MQIFKVLILLGFLIYQWQLNNFGFEHPILAIIWCILEIFIFSFGFVVFTDWLSGKRAKRDFVIFISVFLMSFGHGDPDYLGVSMIFAVITFLFYIYLGGRSLVDTKPKEKEYWRKLDLEIEEKVEAIVKANIASGKNVPTRIQDIPGFPCSDYQELREKFVSGKLMVWQISSFNGELFDMLAHPFDRLLTYIKVVIQFFGSTIISLILAIYISWWFLLGILTFPFFTALMVPFGKKLYKRVIFRAAYQSELIFCLLYFLNEIQLTTPEKDKFWSYIK